MDARAVRRHFARAAATYDGAAVLQREVGRRMAERLDVVKLAPAAILDAGCGTGDAQAELALRYPDARRVALDVALPMLGMAQAKAGQRRSALARVLSAFTGGPGGGEADFVCGDVAALPFAGGSFDLAWSNLMLQWAERPAGGARGARPRACAPTDSSRSRRSARTRCGNCARPSPASTATCTSAGSPTCTTSATCWSARVSATR